ncbi:FACT complex subunit spt16 [Ancistrocladus abbreviatus]
MADHANSTGLSQGAKDGGGDRNAYHINIENFTERLRSFYFHWREHKAELRADCSALAIATPPPSKSWALNMRLLGYEFPETLMVLSEKQIHFLCSQNKASMLDVIKKAAGEAVEVDAVMHVKEKGDDGTRQMDANLPAIRSDNNPVVGYLAKEAHEGDLMRTWTEKLKKNLRLIDASNGLSDLLTGKGVSYRFNEDDKEEQKHKVIYFCVTSELELRCFKVSWTNEQHMRLVLEHIYILLGRPWLM